MTLAIDDNKYRKMMEQWADWQCFDHPPVSGYPRSSAFTHESVDNARGPLIPVSSYPDVERVEIYVSGLANVNRKHADVLRAHWEAGKKWMNLDQPKKAKLLGMTERTFRSEVAMATVGVKAWMLADRFMPVMVAARMACR